MNSDDILKLILGFFSGAILTVALIGGLKEGKERFKKLNEHLDEKEKEAHEKEYRPEDAHQFH